MSSGMEIRGRSSVFQRREALNQCTDEIMWGTLPAREAQASRRCNSAPNYIRRDRIRLLKPEHVCFSEIGLINLCISKFYCSLPTMSHHQAEGRFSLSHCPPCPTLAVASPITTHLSP